MKPTPTPPQPSPEPEPARGELIIHRLGSRRVPIEPRPWILGRGSDADIVLEDESVSRRHCRVAPDAEGGWVVEDLASLGGTRLDGALIEGPTRWRPGGWLRLGETAIQLAPDDASVVLSGRPEQDDGLLRELVDAMGALARARRLDEVLGLIVERGIRVAGGERGALFLLSPGGDLELAFGRDGNGDELAPGEVVTHSLPRQALERNRPVVLADSHLEPEGVPPSLFESRRRSVVCVPLPGDGGARGVLYVDSPRPARDLGAAEVATLATLAGHAGWALERAESDERRTRREQEREREASALRAGLSGSEPLGNSAAWRRAMDLVRRVAPSDATVLLRGETGTGKEIVARALHRAGPRRGGPFVVVDCGALPASLIEGELFGHERGAFTGALRRRVGHLERADGGTLLLDEVGELPLPLQTRLLRFLQERTVQPLGGRSKAVDVRVIAAGHRDLALMVTEGTFRQDLFFRLAVLEIDIPPLRERGEDAELLAREFLRRLGSERALSHGAREALRDHDWPGNVRELEHRVQRADLLAGGPYLSAADLGLVGSQSGRRERAAIEAEEHRSELLPLPEARARATERFERSYLDRALKAADGSASRAAELAGVSRQMIYQLLKKHELRQFDKLSLTN